MSEQANDTPVVPEVDVAGRAALVAFLHGQHDGNHCVHWATGSFCERWADSILSSDWYATLRERVRVVEGEREELAEALMDLAARLEALDVNLDDLAAVQRVSHRVQNARAESAEAAHAELRAGVGALAGRYAAEGAARDAAGKPAWPNNVARDLRALLDGPTP